MTNKAKEELAKYWIPIVVFICMMVAYVWSSATRFQLIESRGLENQIDIKDLKQRTHEKFNRIDDKLDIILQKLR